MNFLSWIYLNGTRKVTVHLLAHEARKRAHEVRDILWWARVPVDPYYDTVELLAVLNAMWQGNL